MKKISVANAVLLIEAFDLEKNVKADHGADYDADDI